jgi:hypothetical protein
MAIPAPRPQALSDKIKAITGGRVIENFALQAQAGRNTVNLSVHSGINRVTNPGKSGSNHLLSSQCETITLSSAKPDGMSITPAANPGQSS